MKKSFVSYFLTSSLSALASASIYAGTMGKIQAETSPDWAWVGTISAGAVWADGGQTQTFYLTPDIIKTYVANHSTGGLFDGELFGGVQIAGPAFLQGQLGLAVAATSNARLSGVIWDDADPRFDNYLYDYNLQHTHIALKGKLLADMNYWVIPWISASVGVGFNRASAFNNQPVIFEAVPNPNFGGHTNTTFTYTVGAGIQRALSQHCQIGIGYEFADWGESNLNPAAQQSLNTGLSLDHFYTNGVLVNVTYLS